MTETYVDTSVLLRSAGEDAEGKVEAVRFLRSRSGHEIHISVETVQEFLFHRMRRADRNLALAQAEALMSSAVVHDFDRGVMRYSIELIRTTSLRGRDAVHAATALRAGLDTLVTFDRDFHGVPGLDVRRP